MLHSATSVRVLLACAVLVVLLSAGCWPKAYGRYLPVIECNETFAQFDNANNTVLTGDRSLEVTIELPASMWFNQAVVCPVNCTAIVRSGSNPALFGSFPYSPSSSICLAAIHAGIIVNSAGGGVAVSRFYRHDWSGGTNQTVYPFEAWRGSLSNGVLSGDVNNSSYRVPAGSRDYSYTVRARGEFMVQRRQAPFASRAEHVHELLFHSGNFTKNSDSAQFLFAVHVVVGGHNDTAYFNDVWVATARLDEQGEDLTWWRLDAAPFSPRSDVLVGRTAAFNAASPTLYFIAGQVGHACGLYELGVCSSEVWQLDATVDLETGRPSVIWRNLTALPSAMASRCSAGLVHTYTGGSDPIDRTSTIVAGQLSYNDSSCSSPPIAVSEQWTLNLTTQAVTRLADAPFSPRRWGSGIGGGGVLVGGIRHVNIIRSSSGQARLIASELTAESWLCLSKDDGAATCNNPRWNGSLNGTVVPQQSLPLPPTATAVSTQSYPPETVSLALSLGGVIPAAAIEQWRLTRPASDRELLDVEWGEVAVNVTLVSAGEMGQDFTSPSDVLEGRSHLPLTAVMDEHELNDPDDNYVRGTAWAMSYTIRGQSFTLHEQPRAFTDSLNDSSWWTPMAASSAATRRPLHNFDLRRRDHVAAAAGVRLLMPGDA